jgi:DNA helicase-2/ATP-dependent DNA helicase PcrA
MEEGLFPHQRSSEEPGRMEEERRLCYVGITRAREQLVVSSAEVRRLYGNESYNMLSRFVREIPDELKQEIRPKAQFSRPVMQAAPVSSMSQDRAREETGLFVGQQVNHARFGDGIVLNLEGQGAQSRVQVNFEKAGSKWLIASMANLQPA